MPTTSPVRMALRERPLPVVAAGVALVAGPALAVLVLGGHPVRIDGTVHFYAVGMTALAAAVAAVALTLVGARFQDVRTVLVGTAFAAMAALLGLHGLATPDFIVGANGVITFTGGLTLPVGAAILALSVVPLPPALRGTRPLLAMQALVLTVIVGLGAVGLAFPQVVPSVPAAGSPEALALLAAGLLLFGVLALRAARTYLLTRRIADLLVLVGLVWLAISLVAALTLTYRELGWWLGHALELDGIVLVGAVVAVDLARGAQSRPLAGDLRAVELVTSEEIFLGSHVRALTSVLAQRDESTEQHTRRVALRAVQVGEELGLSTRRLRILAIGGLVHDIGKLSVPDAILKKPGPLDDEELAVIRRHPVWGGRLLDEVGEFPEGVRRLVRDHHERLDGAGYPNGLTEAELDLDTRILTVCDVYDALISPRVYRDAWTHEEAMALLRSEAGTAFDERCVQALEAVLRREAEVESAAASPTAVPVATGTPAPNVA